MKMLGIYQLTHPESMTKTELLHVLKNSCIDENTYKNLKISELIELYRRIAMPLPKRKENENESLTGRKSKGEKDLSNKSFENTVSMNCVRSSNGELDKIDKIDKICQPLDIEESKSSLNEVKQSPTKIQLCNLNNVKYSGTVKRLNEKDEDAPLNKRQKITWP